MPEHAKEKAELLPTIDEASVLRRKEESKIGGGLRWFAIRARIRRLPPTCAAEGIAPHRVYERRLLLGYRRRRLRIVCEACRLPQLPGLSGRNRARMPRLHMFFSSSRAVNKRECDRKPRRRKVD